MYHAPVTCFMLKASSEVVLSRNLKPSFQPMYYSSRFPGVSSIMFNSISIPSAFPFSVPDALAFNVFSIRWKRQKTSTAKTDAIFYLFESYYFVTAFNFIALCVSSSSCASQPVAVLSCPKWLQWCGQNHWNVDQLSKIFPKILLQELQGNSGKHSRLSRLC